MTDDRFDELMRDAAHTYRKPPQAQFDAMWQQIEAAHFGNEHSHTPKEGTEARRPRFAMPRWVGIAATLVIGVGIGRYSMTMGHSPFTSRPAATVASAPTGTLNADSVAAGPYEVETSKYLGQTAALLIALPSEARSGHTDEQLVTRASDLLNRTRLLMDSPAASDPQMQSLLEDLELVLAQVVRLPGNHSRTDLDLINRALEQRDVIPRLRTAVADISAN